MNKNELIITEFDQITIRSSTQIIKALIPFLAPREQKMIGIMVRIWELILTLRFFEKECIPTRERNSNANMINHIKRYCTPESQKTIDMLLNFMNMSELMKIMNVFDGENTSAGPLDGLFNSFSGGQSEFSMSNLADIMNMFQTMSQTANDMTENFTPNSQSDSRSESQFDSQSNSQSGSRSDSQFCTHTNATHGTQTASIQPVNLLQSMMNPAQSGLYEEFMEKLNETMDD